ncbi:MAG: type II toxin-antitoxin system RelE/ParE family toxin [Planctomycetota bacterium]
MIVLISDDAEFDLVEGRSFYDQHGPEIGDLFCNSMLADVQSLSVVGGIHAQRFGYYCMAAKRFPYGIYYAIDETTVSIVAILDERRDPKWIQRRLTRG